MPFPYHLHDVPFKGWFFLLFSSPELISRHTQKQDEQTHKITVTSPPSFFNSCVTISHVLFPPSIGYQTWRIGLNTFLKASHHIDISEAETMKYIANNTSIPVPKVQQVWHQDEVTYIMMVIVDGAELHYAWHDMSGRTKCWVVEQLKGYLGQLCTLKPPIDGAVMSVIGGPMRDSSRVGLETFGPFQSHNDFHHFSCRGGVGIPMEAFKNMRGIEQVVDSHRQHYATKFMHGDFAPRNIMVKHDGTIMAIINWDSAGWFPEYWGYTKAMFTPYALDDWIESIGEMTGRYDEQLAGECQLYKVCRHELT